MLNFDHFIERIFFYFSTHHAYNSLQSLGHNVSFIIVAKNFDN